MVRMATEVLNTVPAEQYSRLRRDVQLIEDTGALFLMTYSDKGIDSNSGIGEQRPELLDVSTAARVNAVHAPRLG